MGLPTSSPTGVDGRKARSIRTREAIVDATLELIYEGHLRPTAAQIAERADLSVRSVFQHFSDLEDLFIAVTARQTNRVAELWQPEAYVGALAARLSQFVARRTRLFEAVAPMRRAACLQEPFSRTVADGLSLSRSLMRVELQMAFQPELDAAREGGDTDLLEALAVSSGWAAWDSLRREAELSADRVAQVMRRTLAALLGGVGEPLPRD